MIDSRPENDETVTPPPSRWRRLLWGIARVGYYVVATAVILATLVVLGAQTQMARDFLTSRLVRIVNDNVAGTFDCESIRIDVFHGVVIEQPVLSVQGMPLLKANEISVAYDIAALVGKTLAVNKIVIDQPQVRLRRGADSVWNVTRFLLPPDTTSAPPPNLVLRLRAVSITNGSIDVDDQTTPRPIDGAFDPLHLALRHVELRASALLDLRARDYIVGIDHLSLYDLHQKPLSIFQLMLTARVRPQGTSIPMLDLTTPTSRLQCSAELDGVDVEREGVGSQVLRKHPLKVTIDAERVNGRDVRYIVPSIDIVDEYALKAALSYSGDRVRIDDIDLRAGDGQIRGTVDVRSITTPEKLSLDITVRESSVRYADVRRRMRFIGLPDLPFLSRTTARKIHLKGHPVDSLAFDVDVSDQPGHAIGSMTLYLRQRPIGYAFNMDIADGDPSVFASNLEKSSINGRLVARGRGFLPRELVGSYDVTLRPSVVMGRRVSAARIDLVSDSPGSLQFDTADVRFGIDVPDSTVAFFEQSQLRRIGMSGRIDISDLEHPSYDVVSSFNALNLAELLREPSLPDILSGSVALKGQGIEIDSIIGSLTASIDEFALRDRALLPFTLSVDSRRSDDSRFIDLEAPFGTIHLAGNFQPSALIEALADCADAVQEEISVRSQPFSKGRSVAYARRRVSEFVPLNMRFDIDVQDVSPLNILLNSVTISTRARTRGTIRATEQNLGIDISELSVTDLLVRADSLVVASDPTRGSAMVNIDWQDSTVKIRDARLNLVGMGVVQVNGLTIKQPSVRLSGEQDVYQIGAAANVNGIEAAVAANVTSTADTMNVQLDSVHVVVDRRQGLEWRAIRQADVRIVHGEYIVNDLLVRRQQSELVAIDGLVSPDRFRDLRVRLSQFSIPDVRRFVKLAEGHPLAYLKGGITQLDLILNGTWAQPQYLMRVDADDITYNGELIGSMVASASYTDRDIVGTMTIRNPRLVNEKSALICAINHMPLDLSLTSVDKRWVMDKPIDIDMTATNLALAAVEPFLPAVEKIQGYGNGNVTIKGTPADLALGGTARFKNASFVASPTNIQYKAEGVVHLDGEKLYLDTITVRNYDRDRRNGIARAEGTVTFDGLSVERVDFFVRSPGLLVMNKGSQARNPKIFGDVVIANGKSGPIKFYGTLDEPHLDGDVDVLFADIVFPQEREGAKARYTSFLYNRSSDSARPYNSVMDVLRQDTAALAAQMMRSGMQDVGKAVENIIKTTTASFSDILRYDLNVYLKGRTLMTMVFGVFEILIADLEPVDANVPLVFTGRFVDNSTNLRGRVRVKDGTSTYKFYKPFLASGTLDFTVGGLSNPKLDLTAVYRDRRFVNERPEDFRVEIAITGTKQKPIARWSVYRNDRKQQGDSAKITGDALMLILLGRTQDELVSTGQGNLVGEVNASLSAVATSALGDLLSGIGGVVQSVQMDLGADVSQTRLTVSGQLWSDVSYRLTGQVSDFAGNSTITVTVPFTVLNNSDAMRYLKLDVSRSVNNTGNITRFQRLWEVKFGARLP
ncbi:MAG: hypothetical protein FGM32_02750 [Candidatus Kapabacteria bacterium]|nr:hypothetical protein [Candidatus Kapabacteria bacterium]